MRDLETAFGGTSAVIEFNKLNSKNPILILLELTYGDPAVTYYFINNEDELAWGGNTYNPLPFTFDVIPAKAANTLPEVKLEVLNLSSMLQVLDENNGLIGCDVTMFIVYATETTGVWSIEGTRSDDYPLRFTYTILKTSVSKTSIQCTLSVPNYFQLPFPARLYRRDWCDFAYKGELCWMYNRTVVSEVDACDHSYANCKAHHADQVSASPPIGVPFGGFPNLGKGSYRY